MAHELLAVLEYFCKDNKVTSVNIMDYGLSILPGVYTREELKKEFDIATGKDEKPWRVEKK